MLIKQVEVEQRTEVHERLREAAVAAIGSRRHPSAMGAISSRIFIVSRDTLERGAEDRH